MSELTLELERKLLGHGANLIGYADVSALPPKVTKGLPRAISIGIGLDPSVIRDIAHGPTQRYFAEYNRVNALLAQLCRRAAEAFRNAGYQADPIPATTENFDRATLSMRLQHKTVATRAGLGWIGKSALLITEEFGPALRLASVLTDAKFETGAPVDTSNCGQCRQCVDRCPANAIIGENWHVGMSRESIYSATACRAVAKELAAREGINGTICGICINACPWTQRYLKQTTGKPKFTIRPFETKDLGTLKELFLEYESFLPFDLSFQHFHREADSLPGRYAPPTGCLLVAESGGQIIGAVALRPLDEGLCEMKRLYVKPAFQGRGIGRALAKAIIEEARRIGYKRMWLDTVLEPAKCLYRSLGFADIPPYQEVPLEGIAYMGLELT